MTHNALPSFIQNLMNWQELPVLEACFFTPIVTSDLLGFLLGLVVRFQKTTAGVSRDPFPITAYFQ